MLVMIPDVLHRQRRSCAVVADVIDDDIAQVWQSAAARSEVLYDRRQGNTHPAALRGVEAGYGERPVLHDVNLRTQRGRDRRPARHERRRQVDAAEVDQRRRRGRPRRHRARRARHHARPAERDRRARHRADARRQGRVRLAHRQGEPRTGRMDEPPRSGRRQGGDRRGARDVPDPRRTTRLPRGQPVRRPAADAGAGDELHHAAEGAADRRAVARAGAGDRRPAAADRPTDGAPTA